MTLPEDLRLQLDAIAADSHSGALELVDRAAGVLLELVHRGTRVEVLEEAARKVMQIQPSMAPLIKLGWTILEALRGGRAPEASLEGLLKEAKEAPRLIAREARPFVEGKAVATLSWSTTVLEALKAGRPREVLCGESRPLCEGTRLAQALAQAGIKVRLGVDVFLLGRLREVDMVVVGADAITPEGLINKVGTYPLAVMAKGEGRPFYVLAGPEKVLPSELKRYLRLSPKPPEEVAELNGVEVENPYFDLTPLRLITAVITPQGPLSPFELFKN